MKECDSFFMFDKVIVPPERDGSIGFDHNILSAIDQFSFLFCAKADLNRHSMSKDIEHSRK